MDYLKSFHLKGFPVTFQAANISFLFWSKGCLFPWGFNSRSGNGVNSSWHFIDISNRRGYQGYVCHVGVTIIIYSTSSWRSFFRIWSIRLKEGKPYENILFQHCCIASVAMLFVSGFHTTYCGSWWHSLDEKRPTVEYPKSLIMLWKMLWCSFQSEGSLIFQDSQSP